MEALLIFLYIVFAFLIGAVIVSGYFALEEYVKQKGIKVHKCNEPKWNAFCTIWWFASGDQIMRTSNKTSLLTEMHTWYLKVIDRYHE